MEKHFLSLNLGCPSHLLGLCRKMHCKKRQPTNPRQVLFKTQQVFEKQGMHLATAPDQSEEDGLLDYKTQMSGLCFGV